MTSVSRVRSERSRSACAPAPSRWSVVLARKHRLRYGASAGPRRSSAFPYDGDTSKTSTPRSTAAATRRGATLCATPITAVPGKPSIERTSPVLPSRRRGIVPAPSSAAPSASAEAVSAARAAPRFRKSLRFIGSSRRTARGRGGRNASPAARARRGPPAQPARGPPGLPPPQDEALEVPALPELQRHRVVRRLPRLRDQRQLHLGLVRRLLHRVRELLRRHARRAAGGDEEPPRRQH